MQKVKIIELSLPSKYKCDIRNEILLNYYNENSNVCKNEWSYKHYKPKSIDSTSEDWQKLCAENLEQIIAEYPKYEPVTITLQFSKYAEIIDAFVDDYESPKVKRVFEVLVAPEPDSLIAMIQMHTELMQKQMQQLNHLTAQSFNDKCNVSVSDSFLHNINQTMLLEDCCTDHLQKQLQNGWRILTICPQPNQRRPDYILGKYVDDPDDAAER